jgi:hypothetical protein
VGYNGGTATWSDLIPGNYTVTETNPGAEWTVVVSGSPATVVAGQTAEAGVTNRHKLGSLQVTNGRWNRVTPDRPDLQIASQAIYPAGDCKTEWEHSRPELIPGLCRGRPIPRGWTMVVQVLRQSVVNSPGSVTSTRRFGTIIIEKRSIVVECCCSVPFSFSSDIAGISHGNRS